jgi:hypothetical protein
MGFYRTPDGSFWDYDDEYFNRYGFDIHGGSYNKELEYIPGPTWLVDLGCYPEDAEKYKNIDLNKLEDDMFDELADGMDGMDDDGGDFEGDFENDSNMITDEELAKLYLGDKDIQKLLDNYTGGDKAVTAKTKPKTKKTKAKKPKKTEEEEGWETVSDEDL